MIFAFEKHKMKLNSYLIFIILEINGNISVLFTPVFKLPFHQDFLVLFKGDVLSLNRVTKHLVLTTDLDFSDAGRLSKLAKLDLVGKRLVDDRRWTVVGNLNLSLLNHILLLFCFVRKIIK
jgi:hypothetical protein